MSDFTKADFHALLRAFFGGKPMTQEETDAAKAAMNKMSPWQSMTMRELEDCISKERAAREPQNDQAK